MNTRNIRSFLAKPAGSGPWSVVEATGFGYVDRDRHVHVVGHLTDPSKLAGLVELLNCAPEFLATHEASLISSVDLDGGSDPLSATSRLLLGREVVLGDGMSPGDPDS